MVRLTLYFCIWGMYYLDFREGAPLANLPWNRLLEHLPYVQGKAI